MTQSFPKARSVAELKPGDRIHYRNDWWTVTRVRNPHIGDYRSLAVRSPHDPHPTEQLMWPGSTIVEVDSDG